MLFGRRVSEYLTRLPKEIWQMLAQLSLVPNSFCGNSNSEGESHAGICCCISIHGLIYNWRSILHLYKSMWGWLSVWCLWRPYSMGYSSCLPSQLYQWCMHARSIQSLLWQDWPPSCVPRKGSESNVAQMNINVFINIFLWYLSLQLLGA